MEDIRFLRRLAAFALFGIALAAVFTFVSCNGDDEEPEEDPTLAGVYQMQEALLTDDIKDVANNVIIQSGSDVTEIMAGGIFGQSPCEDPANSAVDMREDGKLFFVCIGDESGVQGVDAGSWTENETLTVLTLNLNATVVPPLGFQLAITDVTKAGSTISGTIGAVPIPGYLLNQAPGLEDIDFPTVQTVGATVKFVEVQ
jgi:hypothetical protein